jgi:hypothetical protein
MVACRKQHCIALNAAAASALTTLLDEPFVMEAGLPLQLVYSEPLPAPIAWVPAAIYCNKPIPSLK